jgi:hypothetical protein
MWMLAKYYPKYRLATSWVNPYGHSVLWNILCKWADTQRMDKSKLKCMTWTHLIWGTECRLYGEGEISLLLKMEEACAHLILPEWTQFHILGITRAYNSFDFNVPYRLCHSKSTSLCPHSACTCQIVSHVLMNVTSLLPTDFISSRLWSLPQSLKTS